MSNQLSDFFIKYGSRHNTNQSVDVLLFHLFTFPLALRFSFYQSFCQIKSEKMDNDEEEHVWRKF